MFHLGPDLTVIWKKNYRCSRSTKTTQQIKTSWDTRSHIMRSAFAQVFFLTSITIHISISHRIARNKSAMDNLSALAQLGICPEEQLIKKYRYRSKKPSSMLIFAWLIWVFFIVWECLLCSLIMHHSSQLLWKHQSWLHLLTPTCCWRTERYMQYEPCNK